MKKKLSRNEMKKVLGGNMPIGGMCSPVPIPGCVVNEDPRYAVYCRGQLLVICPLD